MHSQLRVTLGEQTDSLPQQLELHVVAEPHLEPGEPGGVSEGRTGECPGITVGSGDLGRLDEGRAGDLEVSGGEQRVTMRKQQTLPFEAAVGHQR